MSESALHSAQVGEIESFVRRMTGPRDDLIIYRDSSESDRQTLPPLMGGYRPDVFARLWKDKRFIIGEAKTQGDLLTAHTRSQLTAFIKEISEDRRGAVVLCAPFAVQPTARALLWELCLGTHLDLELYCIHSGLCDISQSRLVADR
jgi:hypothetical protein